MSRRHHGRPHHARHRPEAPRPSGQATSPGAPGAAGQPVPDARPRTSTDVPDPSTRVAESRPAEGSRPAVPTVMPGERIAARPFDATARVTGDAFAQAPAHEPARSEASGAVLDDRPAAPVAASTSSASAGPAAMPAHPAPPPRPATDDHARADRQPTAGPADTVRPAHAPGRPVGSDNVAGPTSNGCTAPQLRRFIKSRPYVPMHELRRRFGILGTDDDVTQVRLEAQAIYVGLPEREGALLGDLLRGGEIGCELSLDPRTPVVIGVYPMRPVPRS